MTLEELKYPTGKWIKVPNLDAAGRAAMIDQIAGVPAALGKAVNEPQCCTSQPSCIPSASLSAVPLLPFMLRLKNCATAEEFDTIRK